MSDINIVRGILPVLDNLSPYLNDNKEYDFDWQNGIWREKFTTSIISNVINESHSNSPILLSNRPSCQYTSSSSANQPLIDSNDSVITLFDKDAFISEYVDYTPFDELKIWSVDVPLIDEIVIRNCDKDTFIANYVYYFDNCSQKPQIDSLKCPLTIITDDILQESINLVKIGFSEEIVTTTTSDNDDFESSLKNYFENIDADDDTPLSFIKNPFLSPRKIIITTEEGETLFHYLENGFFRKFNTDYYFKHRTSMAIIMEKAIKRKSTEECVKVFNMPSWVNDFFELSPENLKTNIFEENSLTLSHWFMLFRLRARQINIEKRSRYATFPAEIYKISTKRTIKKYLKQDNPKITTSLIKKGKVGKIRKIFSQITDPFQKEIARYLRRREMKLLLSNKTENV